MGSRRKCRAFAVTRMIRLSTTAEACSSALASGMAATTDSVRRWYGTEDGQAVRKVSITACRPAFGGDGRARGGFIAVLAGFGGRLRLEQGSEVHVRELGAFRVLQHGGRAIRVHDQALAELPANGEIQVLLAHLRSGLRQLGQMLGDIGAIGRGERAVQFRVGQINQSGLLDRGDEFQEVAGRIDCFQILVEKIVVRLFGKPGRRWPGPISWDCHPRGLAGAAPAFPWRVAAFQSASWRRSC